MFFYVSNSSPFVRNFLQKIIISKGLNQKNQSYIMKKVVVSLQANHIFYVIMHKSIQTYKRISFCIF